MTQADIDVWRGPYQVWNRLAGIIVFTLFTLYPTLVSSMASMFHCTDQIDGTRYLVADYSVKCYEGGHIAMVFFACISAAVYAVGIPVAVAVLVALKTPIVCVENEILIRGKDDA